MAKRYPYIPMYYKSKGAKIFRNTTDAPPRAHDNGGGLNPDGTQQVDLPEATVYGAPESRKLQGTLRQKLDQLKRAAQKYYEDRGFGRIFLKQDPTSEISGLKQNVQAYKDLLEEEKGRYAKAEIALQDLQKHYPDTWGDKKLVDVFTPQGYQSLLSLQKNDKISTDRFRTYYDNFAKEFDPYMAKGKGSDAVYSAKGARQAWGKDWDEFTGMINKFALAAPMLGAAGALAPAAGSFSVPGLGSAAKASLTAPMFSGAPSWLTPLTALEFYGAHHMASELGRSDSDTRKSLRKAYQDPTASNIAGAVGDTGFAVLGGAPTGITAAKWLASRGPGAVRAVRNLPQIKDFKTGLKNVMKGEAKLSDMLKSQTLYRFDKPAINIPSTSPIPNDPLKGRWYMSTKNPDLIKYYKENPLFKRVTGTKASLKPFNVSEMQQAAASGKTMPLDHTTAIGRSISSAENPAMQAYIKQFPIRSKYSVVPSREEIWSLVNKPHSYWKDPLYKYNPAMQQVLKSAPASRHEYVLPSDIAFPAPKGKELFDINYNPVSDLPAQWRILAKEAEAAVEPVYAGAQRFAKPFGKGTKVVKASGIRDEDQNQELNIDPRIYEAARKGVFMSGWDLLNENE